MSTTHRDIVIVYTRNCGHVTDFTRRPIEDGHISLEYSHNLYRSQLFTRYQDTVTAGLRRI